MSFLSDNTVDSYEDKPGISVFYGRHGMGKTTTACKAFPKPYLANFEKTTPKGINVPSMKIGDKTEDGQIVSYGAQQFQDLIAALLTEEHDFQTLIIDTIDTFEPMLEKMICDQNGWQNISAPDFGVGFTEAASRFGYFMQGLHKLRDVKRMHIVILAHVEVTRFDDPRMGSYSTYEIAVRRRVREVLSNLSDAVFFMSQDPTIDQKKGEAAKAKASQNIFLFTQPSPAFNAKNMWNMPSKVLVPYDDPRSAIAEHFPGFGQVELSATKEAA